MSTESFSEHELRLLDAIHGDPRNDSPRFAYANWLADSDHADLAEFVRLQCTEPYILLDTGGGARPRLSGGNYWMEREDPVRTHRAIELLKRLHGSRRFPNARFWTEYYRGLPLYEASFDDHYLPESPEDVYASPSPLARYRLILSTSRLADWLAHPIMRFVENLRIRPVLEGLAPTVLTPDDVLGLAACPFIDRLQEIALMGVVDEETRRLAQERLEPRVPVEYDL